MPTLRLKIKYSNSSNSLIYSASELLEFHFFGIPMNTYDGRELSSTIIEQKMLIAQTQIENMLEVKLFKQTFTEQVDFQKDEYKNWGFMKTTYPIQKVHSLVGWLGSVQQTQYPVEWVSIHKPSNEGLLSRTVHLVPNGASNVVNSLVFIGIIPNLGYMGMDSIPNYWEMKYCTGFNRVPMDIVDVIGKLAAIPLLAILGDIMLGIGITSTSLSLDGLSQSISSSKSATSSIFSARISQYTAELKEQLPILRDYYKGLQMAVC